MSTKVARKSPKVTSVGKGNYNDIREEVEQPFSERKKHSDGRNGSLTVHRKYHLTGIERRDIIEKHRALGGGDVVNPLCTRTGTYWAQVESLIQLGVNEYHSHKQVRDRMKMIMEVIPKSRKDKGTGQSVQTDAWKDFFGKSARIGAANPKDGDGKITQNFHVLQRIIRPGNHEKNPYGLKLAQFCMSVDIKFIEASPGIVIPHYRLNTQWTSESEVAPNLDKTACKRK